MRDPYTAGHQRRVAQLAAAIADELGMAKDEIEGLRLAATIHDIGKIAIPAEILARPGTLSAIEFSLLKQHPRAGYDILKEIPFPWPIADMVLQHHERLDGSGYPDAITGDQILPESRILAVADVVEAMNSHRPTARHSGSRLPWTRSGPSGRASSTLPPWTPACASLKKSASLSNKETTALGQREGPPTTMDLSTRAIACLSPMAERAYAKSASRSMVTPGSARGCTVPPSHLASA